MSFNYTWIGVNSKTCQAALVNQRCFDCGEGTEAGLLMETRVGQGEWRDHVGVLILQRHKLATSKRGTWLNLDTAP